jgi:hypothetical protein
LRPLTQHGPMVPFSRAYFASVQESKPSIMNTIERP